MTPEQEEKVFDKYVTIFYVQHEWTAPDNPKLKRWKLIIDDGTDLNWAYTYNPSLALLGTQRVEFYRDTSMRCCIRKPKKEQSHDTV